MFQVLYLCKFRPHFYDDIEPMWDWSSAVQTCQQVARQRRCYACVVSGGQVVYESDYR